MNRHQPASNGAHPDRPAGGDAGAAEPGQQVPDPRLFVAGVEKALRILELFDENTPGLSIADIDERTELGRSAAQRYIYTLVWLGYLRRDPATRQYSPTTRVLRLMRSLTGRQSLLEQGKKHLAELARQTRETVSWVELDADHIVIVANYPSTYVTHVNLPVGSRFPALASSSGRVLLSHAPQEDLLARLQRLPAQMRGRLGPRSDTDILALLRRDARQGFSITTNDIENSISISAPITDLAGRIVAVVNLSTLRSRYDSASARRELLPLVLQTARAISVPAGGPAEAA